MIKHARRIALIILAVLLILVGTAGLVLPILPGIVLLILGLLLLSMFYPALDSWIHSLTKKNPQAHATAQKFRDFLQRIIGSDK
jgi:uncharacterized membrane protein YbaN (DUF454 family)